MSAVAVFSYTHSVNVRRDGDAFQARIFWLKAAKLLDDQGNIVRVGFESGPRGFDDVWIEYDPRKAPLDQYGQPLAVERLQCKWHAGLGAYTFPRFWSLHPCQKRVRCCAKGRLPCVPGGSLFHISAHIK